MAWLTKPRVSPRITAALLSELKQLLSKFRAMDYLKPTTVLSHGSRAMWGSWQAGEQKGFTWLLKTSKESSDGRGRNRCKEAAKGRGQFQACDRSVQSKAMGVKR